MDYMDWVQKVFIGWIKWQDFHCYCWHSLFKASLIGFCGALSSLSHSNCDSHLLCFPSSVSSSHPSLCISLYIYIYRYITVVWWVVTCFSPGIAPNYQNVFFKTPDNLRSGSPTGVDHYFKLLHIILAICYFSQLKIAVVPECAFN